MPTDPTQVSGHPTQRAVRHGRRSELVLAGSRPASTRVPGGGRSSSEAASFAREASAGFGAWGHDAHVHDDHQLIYTPLGHAVVWAQGRAHHLTANVALWIPARVWHAARFDADCLVAPVMFAAERFGAPSEGCAEVVVTERRRRMLLAHLRERLDDAEPSVELYEALVSDAGQVPLPMPTSTVPHAVASVLVATPNDPRTLTEWAETFYTSPTSLRRAFLAETGLTFSEWRTRARINASVDLLARDGKVSVVAQQVGFTSANGFILAFRRYFGVTPKVYATGLAA
ncbi:AraC family transcriptional regulator [Micropruina sp.]|uniref:helix-turn-helix transcriptional regulator n=1 Tax=Micropruina sp. TaxID=2737536 RepID=UPI0039E43E2A